MIFRLIALAFIAFLAAAPAGARPKEKAEAAPAAPPLWRVSDDDSSLYLFGTIGAPAPDKTWRTRAVARAIDQSETMWFEAPVDEPAAIEGANRIFAARGASGAGALTASLAPAEAEALVARAAAVGLDIASLEPLRPWAAFVLLSARMHQDAAGENVDAALLAEARGRGRAVRYFFSIEESLGVLTEMPKAEERRLLTQYVGDFERQRNEAGAAYADWRAGDLAATDAYLNAALRAEAPAVHARLVDGRIEALAPKVAALLDSAGTGFVALSAAYLVGAGGLPERLAEAGLSVERIAE